MSVLVVRVPLLDSQATNYSGSNFSETFEHTCHFQPAVAELKIVWYKWSSEMNSTGQQHARQARAFFPPFFVYLFVCVRKMRAITGRRIKCARVDASLHQHDGV
jgi:hypothetical protein